MKWGVSKMWFAFTSLCDTFGSCLQVVAYLLMPASINQMLSGGIIVSTCILSRLILGRTVHPHNALGCAIAVVGFVFVGFASLTNGNALEQYGVQSMTIGILMVVSS